MATSDSVFPNSCDPNSPLDIAPISGRIGAEIRSVQLAGDLPESTISAISAALARHKVIFFRDQHALDDTRHEAFADRLGTAVAHPTIDPATGSRTIFQVGHAEGFTANTWHTDVTFLPAPPAASILRAVVIPEAGGDTLWANTATAYAYLPKELKALANTLRVVHSNVLNYEEIYPEIAKERLDQFRANFVAVEYETEHPAVRVHPVTGEPCLLLGQFARRLVGLNTANSQSLLTVLQNEIIQPENTVRWRWRKGDVAIWDNRATQHRAIIDYGGQTRLLRRVTIQGEVPVGLDAVPSRALRPVAKGDLRAAE